jgi:hypothetical protein
VYVFVTHSFLPLVFFFCHQPSPNGPLKIPQLKIEVGFKFAEIFEFESRSPRSDTSHNNKIVYTVLGGSLSLGHLGLD